MACGTTRIVQAVDKSTPLNHRGRAAPSHLSAGVIKIKLSALAGINLPVTCIAYLAMMQRLSAPQHLCLGSDCF